MSEMPFNSVGHMSGAVKLNHVCTQLRFKPNSHVIFWARRRIEDAKKKKKEEEHDDEWVARASGQKRAFQ